MQHLKLAITVACHIHFFFPIDVFHKLYEHHLRNIKRFTNSPDLLIRGVTVTINSASHTEGNLISKLIFEGLQTRETRHQSTWHIGLLPNNIKKQSNIYRRLQSDNQSVTITHVRKSLLIHPELNRTISAREAARLQGVDDDFIFKGGRDSIYQQIANAVPPIFIKEVAKEIRQCLDI